MNIENIVENDVDNDEEMVENLSILSQQQWKSEMEYGNTYYAAKEYVENFFYE